MTCYSPKDMKSFGCDALIPVKDHMILTPACKSAKLQGSSELLYLEARHSLKAL